MAAGMGSVRFGDAKSGVHLSGPGWGALGVVFYDLDAVLAVQDLEAAGRRLGEID